MINVDEHFSKGSAGHEIASQALSQINQARDAGLNTEADRLEASLEASIINLRKSKGKDVSGFNTVLKSIGGLAPQVQAVAKEKNEISSLGSQIDSTITLFESSGGKLTEEQSAAIAAAKEQGNKAALSTYNDLFGKQTAALIERQLPMNSADQAKADAAKKEKEIKDIGLIDQSTQFVNLLDKLEKHKGFDNLFGTNVSFTPTWMAATDAADAKVLFKQIDAKGFMEAIKQMKGMGALSNAEGEKASAAFLGLDTSMSEEAAKEAIGEAKRIIKKGIDNSKKILEGEGVSMNDSSTPVESRPENQVKAINDFFKQNSTTK